LANEQSRPVRGGRVSAKITLLIHYSQEGPMNHICARIEVLDEADLQRIHEATLAVLWRTGCRLPHRRILDRLEEQGATVDRANAVAHLPEALVTDAMAALRPASPSPEERWEQGVLRGRPLTIHPGNEANIVDYASLERRRGNSTDVLRGITLCNALSRVRSAMPLVTPSDCPAAMADVYGYYLCALYSAKPFSVYLMSPGAAEAIIALSTVRHGPDARRPGYLLEPNGALSYDEISLELALRFVEAGGSFHIGPMAMAGLDAPVTLAGTLVMQNAYNWIGSVVAYLWGAAGSWGGGAHAVDMRSMLCSFGSPNQVLLGLGAAQLGQWYGFQPSVNSALTDACVPDFQGGFEKGVSALTALLAGANFGAQGIVGADQGTSLEQLVIDNEWASYLDHILSHGIPVDDASLAVDEIMQAGILGGHIASEHTVRHMRATYWRSTIFNHEGFDAWAERGGRDAYACAHQEVERILAKHYPPVLQVEEAVRAELEAIWQDAQAHPERFRVEAWRYTP
jgi:trimethylamine--corrinoid protein Co-methyltransferase